MIPLRPLLLGFIRAADDAEPVAVKRLESQLAAYASREGYLLGVIYREPPGGAGAFATMIDHLTRNDAAGVVVPNLAHIIVDGVDRIAVLKELGMLVHEAAP